MKKLISNATLALAFAIAAVAQSPNAVTNAEDLYQKTRQAREDFATRKELDGKAGRELRDEARKAVAAALSTLAGDSASADAMSLRFRLASAAWDLGDFETARSGFESVRQYYAKHHPDFDLQVRLFLGDTLGRLGRYQEALDHHHWVVTRLQEKPDADASLVYRARGSLALTMKNLGDPAGALVTQEAIVAALRGDRDADDAELLAAQANLAVTYLDEGQLDRGVELQEQILAVHRKRLAAGLIEENDPDLLNAHVDLADTLALLGDQLGALELARSVVDIGEDHPPDDLEIVHKARLYMGYSLMASGQLAPGLAEMKRAIEDLERSVPDDHWMLYWARDSYAAGLFQNGDVQGALDLATAAIDYFETRDQTQWLISRSDRARWLRGLEDQVERSRREIDEVLVAMKDRKAPIFARDMRFLRQDQVLNLAELGDKRLPELMDDIATLANQDMLSRNVMRSTHQVGELMEALRDDVDLLLSFMDRGNAGLPGRTFGLIETMRSIPWQAARQQSRSSRDPETAGLSKQLRDAAKQIAERVTATATAAASQGKQKHGATDKPLSQLIQDREILARRLMRGFEFKSVDPQAVARQLAKDGPDRLAVGYRRVQLRKIDRTQPKRVATEVCLLANVLRRDGSVKSAAIGPLSEVTKATEAWRMAIGRPVGGGTRPMGTPEEQRAAGEALRKLVLDPVRDVVEKDATLHVCVDDVLHLVPLDALPLGDGVVGDQLRIRNEVSFLRPQNAAPATSKADRLVAIGDVAYGDIAAAGDETHATQRGRDPDLGRWQPLRRSGEEVDAVASLFEKVHRRTPVRLTGRDATKQSFEWQAKKALFLHLVTHGYFAHDVVRAQGDVPQEQSELRRLRETVPGLAPMTLCGLAFARANEVGPAEGVLTAEELAGMDLGHCELAVLSACETNVGSARAGIGIHSLQSALHAAGVQTAITTLWTVSDEWALALMREFYRQLWVEKASKADALWLAKRNLREAGAPVAEWAAWVLTGDPR